MIDPEGVQKIRHNIAKIAQSEEEAMRIIQLLQTTNWMNYFDREQPSITKCHRCNCLLPELTVGGYEMCTDCEQFICALCKQSTLKDDYYGYYYRVICESCLTRRNIDEKWLRPEANRVGGHEIRAWRLGQIGDLPFRQWLTTLEDFNWLCAYCQKVPYKVIEHFVPLVKGGDTIPANCVPACQSCNSAKITKHPNDVTAIPQEDLARVRVYLSTRL